MSGVVCTSAECWAAVSGILQAVASLLSAAAVIYAARLASTTIHTYRLQKQEDKRIQAAHEILSFVYKFMLILLGLRDPLNRFEIQETEEAVRDRLKEWDTLQPRLQEAIIASDILLDRLHSKRSDLDRIWEIIPTARTFFETNVLDEIIALWEMLERFEQAAVRHIDEFALSPEETRETRQTLWRRSSDDSFEEQVRDIVERLDDLLLPILRSDYAKASLPHHSSR